MISLKKHNQNTGYEGRGEFHRIFLGYKGKKLIKGRGQKKKGKKKGKKKKREKRNKKKNKKQQKKKIKKKKENTKNRGVL